VLGHLKEDQEVDTANNELHATMVNGQLDFWMEEFAGVRFGWSYRNRDGDAALYHTTTLHPMLRPELPAGSPIDHGWAALDCNLSADHCHHEAVALQKQECHSYIGWVKDTPGEPPLVPFIDLAFNVDVSTLSATKRHSLLRRLSGSMRKSLSRLSTSSLGREGSVKE